MPSELSSIAIIGGTGPEGRGLGAWFARSGSEVSIGSRQRDRAQAVAAELRSGDAGLRISGYANDEAASRGEIVVLTIPFSAVSDTVPLLSDHVRGKVVISAIAPIEFREGRPHALRVEAGSAAEEVQRLLPDARVVSAFQTVDAHTLNDPQARLDTDVIVCSDDVEARRLVASLAGRIPGVRGLSGGRLAASRYVEECTALLITMNRIYKVHSGLRITGVNR